jgi:nicotinamidase-related amidase
METQKQSSAFLTYLAQWEAGLPLFDMAKELGDPHRAAIVSVDVINGFCYEGPLASQRVATIVPPLVRLFRRAYELGMRDFVLIQEAHSEHAKEFEAWGTHCVRGSSEVQTVKELAELPFAHEFVTITKNTIHPALGTTFDRWLADHPNITTFFAVGDCTDLCTYQLAMYLKLAANATDTQRRVIVPADCVQTYDMPVDVAVQLGIKPHDGDLFHTLFLYHMAMNGIEVVKGVQ